MSRSAFYRIKAAEICERLKSETSGSLRSELLRLAEGYLRMSEKADHQGQTPQKPPEKSTASQEPDQSYAR